MDIQTVVGLVARSLGGSIPDQIRQHPEWSERLENAVREVNDYGVEVPDAINSLGSWIRNEMAFAAGARRSRKDASEVVLVPPDARFRALAEILATEAAERPDVRSFRGELLKDRLIAPDLESLDGWIRRFQNEDGEPTMTQVTGGGASREYPLHYLSVPAADHEDDLFLSWGGSRPILVRVDGVLGRLRFLALTLAARYGWSQPEAVSFVLAGRTPSFPRGRVETFWRLDQRANSSYEPEWHFPSEYVVRLELSVSLSPRETADLYRHARESMRRGRRRERPISLHSAELAVFAYKNRVGHTWRDAMNLWNNEEHGQEYSEVRLFTRDAREAFRRVTQMELSWTGLGRAKQRKPRQREGTR